MLYVYMPNCKVEWRDAVIGGLIAAIAFELGKRGFGYYVRRIPTYTAVYGAFAALPVFLLWVYLCWMIALIGAMVASALPAIRIGQFHRPIFRAATARFARTAGAARRGTRARASPARRRSNSRGCCVAIWTRRRVSCCKSWRRRAGSDGCRKTCAVRAIVLIANPNQITVTMLFDLFVIDRDELDYQLRLDATQVDRAAVMGALENEKLDITLCSLIAARRSALTDASLRNATRLADAAPARLRRLIA